MKTRRPFIHRHCARRERCLSASLITSLSECLKPSQNLPRAVIPITILTHQKPDMISQLARVDQHPKGQSHKNAKIGESEKFDRLFRASLSSTSNGFPNECVRNVLNGFGLGEFKANRSTFKPVLLDCYECSSRGKQIMSPPARDTKHPHSFHPLGVTTAKFG